MATSRHHAQRAVFVIVAALLGLSFFAPMVALADDTLAAGQTATVTTGGGDASLRGEPSVEVEVVGTAPEGAAVSILEGPVPGADGSLWYGVSVNGVTGYIAADLVSGDTPAAPTEPSEVPESDATEATDTDADAADEAGTEPADEAAPSIPWSEPVDFGVVVDSTEEPLPADGLACRADASTDADVIVRLASGEAVEVTGDEVWAGGVAFTPINCAGAGGFVRSDYVLLDSEAAVEEPTEAVTEEATEEPVVEVPSETVAATEEEVVAEETVAVEVTAEPTSTEDAEEATTAATEEPTVEDVTAEPATEPVTETAVVETDPTEATGDVAGEEEAVEVTATATAATEAVETEVAEETPEVDSTPEAVTTEVPVSATTPEAESDEAAPATPDAPADATEETDASTPDARSNQAPANEVAGRGRATTTPTATRTPTQAPAPATPSATADSDADADAPATATSQSEQQVDQAATTSTTARTQVDPSRAIGTAEVQGTNGDGVRCRTSASADASTITVLAEGTTVQVLSVERNGYLGVICGGQAGFANVTYLWSGGAGDEIAANAGSVTVVGSGGGLNCRAGAGTSYSVLTVLREGTTVSIRGASSNGWAPVVCGGQNGYVSIDYVEATGSASSGSDGSVSAAAATMVVSGTNGDGVRCRSAASTSASIITVLGEGTRVSARGSASGGWVPVTCAGRSGYVSATYLRASSGSTSGGGSTSGSGWSFVKVVNTGGGGVRCRSSASLSGAIIMVVGEGRSMGVRGTASNGWLPVNCGGRSGFVSTQYVTSTSRTTPTAPAPSPTPTPPTSGWSMVSGDHAKVTDRLNLRYSPSLGAGIATTIPAGTVVQITGRATGGFYPINWDGLRGYVSQDYIYKTTAALSERGGSAPTSPTAPPTNDGDSNATGNAMVSFALRYEGYPYIWAQHGPSGFDCSGFTYWVTKNVTGKDIGTGLWTQVSAGTPVSRSALQPGDLVFFQNTYKAGLSHSGVYIGNNRFIHAENETTGVRISDLNSTYYGSRWYGARRMT